MKLGSSEPGKSLQENQPEYTKGDSTPDGRGKNSDGDGKMATSSGPTKLGDGLSKIFKRGLISGGKGQSVADKI